MCRSRSGEAGEVRLALSTVDYGNLPQPQPYCTALHRTAAVLRRVQVTTAVHGQPCHDVRHGDLRAAVPFLRQATRWATGIADRMLPLPMGPKESIYSTACDSIVFEYAPSLGAICHASVATLLIVSDTWRDSHGSTAQCG